MMMSVMPRREEFQWIVCVKSDYACRNMTESEYLRLMREDF